LIQYYESNDTMLTHFVQYCQLSTRLYKQQWQGAAVV